MMIIKDEAFKTVRRGDFDHLIENSFVEKSHQPMTFCC